MVERPGEFIEGLAIALKRNLALKYWWIEGSKHRTMRSESQLKYRIEVIQQLAEWKTRNKGTAEQIGAAERLLDAIESFDRLRGGSSSFEAAIPPSHLRRF